MKKLIYLFCLVLALGACTNLDEEAFDQLPAELYYTDAATVEMAVLRVYDHAHWCGWDGDRWLLQELTADNFAWCQKGKHGYDDGKWVRLHGHDWNPDLDQVNGSWVGPYQGIGQCNVFMEEFAKLDFVALGIPDETKKMYYAELKVLRAWYYMFLLDFFREVPIVLDSKTIQAQSSPQEVFAFIENELIENGPLLRKSPPKGRWSQAAVAGLLVRLYLNAKVYTGVDKSVECAKIAEKIIGGEYGTYSIDLDYRGPFKSGANGVFSPENIMEFPHKRNTYNFGWIYDAMSHYKYKNAYDNTAGGWNGIHMTPSRDMKGAFYSYKLGMPYEKFANGDFRKQNFHTTSNMGDYEGFFAVGQLRMYDPKKGYGFRDPDLTTDTIATEAQEWRVLGGEEWKDLPLVFVDQVGLFRRDPELAQKKGEDEKVYKTRMSIFLKEVNKRGYFIATADTVLNKGSQIVTGEENTGIRLLKFPWLQESKNLFMMSSAPEMRLAEIKAALAECKYRAGDKAGAGVILDEFRKRNYPTDIWSQYSYAANPSLLTDQEFVDELGREFLGERHRRTDLIRWGRFGDEWWAKPQDTKDKTVFPIPNRALNANPLLKTNGY